MAFIAADELLGGILVVAQLDLLGELVGDASVRVDGEGFEGVFESCFEVGVLRLVLKHSIADYIGYDRLGQLFLMNVFSQIVNDLPFQ